MSVTGLFTILVLVFELDRHLTGNWSADVVFTYLLILAVINCLCNPLIYAFKLDIVRRQFRSSFLFRCFASCAVIQGSFSRILLIILSRTYKESFVKKAFHCHDYNKSRNFRITTFTCIIETHASI